MITINTLTIDWGDGSTPEDFSGGTGGHHLHHILIVIQLEDIL